jgi:hypothetical protein
MARTPRVPEPPATFIKAEEKTIVEAVARWRAAREELFRPEAANRYFAEVFLKHLQAGSPGCFSPAYIVGVAKNGHPAADRAVRAFIDEHMDRDRFQELPMCVREYARQSLWHPAPARGYPSRAPKTMDHLIRDLALYLAMHRVVEEWPAVPLLHRTYRRSAADLVGEAFNMSEKQVQRCYQTPGELALKFFDFLWLYRTSDPDLFAGYR